MEGWRVSWGWFYSGRNRRADMKHVAVIYIYIYILRDLELNEESAQ